MEKINTWVSAARLRTLPLSISGILIGTSIAAQQGVFNIVIFSLALGTTLGLQILSNFANDYGDGVKGTDNLERVGPARAIQSGLITRQQMKTGIIITAAATLLLAILLIYTAFGTDNFLLAILFLGLGIGAIVAAIKYTVGDSAYGYRGLGDVFVFLFFGIVSVFGSYFLYAMNFNWPVLLPAAAIGLLSAGVLNLNNLRDRQSDAKAGKNTLVVKLGEQRGKDYHYALLIGAIFCFLVYSALTAEVLSDLLYLIGFIPVFLHMGRVIRNQNAMLLDPELKILALSTFLIAILFSVGILIGHY